MSIYNCKTHETLKAFLNFHKTRSLKAKVLQNHEMLNFAIVFLEIAMGKLLILTQKYLNLIRYCLILYNWQC